MVFNTRAIKHLKPNPAGKQYLNESIRHYMSGVKIYINVCFGSRSV